MTEDILNYIKKSAEGELPGEDFIVDDYAGGNIDDAYSLGAEHGYREAMQTILKMIEKSQEIK